MERPDLATLSCVHVDCQHFGRPEQGNLIIRKRYGKDRLRLLRCRSCQEEFSERRGTALFNTKVSEAKASDIIDHLDEGCSVRSTARLTKSAKETVARLLKVSGRHAQRFHVRLRTVIKRAYRKLSGDNAWSPELATAQERGTRLKIAKTPFYATSPLLHPKHRYNPATARGSAIFKPKHPPLIFRINNRHNPVTTRVVSVFRIDTRGGQKIRSRPLLASSLNCAW